MNISEIVRCEKNERFSLETFSFTAVVKER